MVKISGMALLSFAAVVAVLSPIAQAANNSTGSVTIGKGTVTFLQDLQATLQAIGPALSAILFVLAGIIYAFGQLQPAEVRGKYQAWAMGLVVGGFVVGALSVAAPTLARIAGGLLT